MRHACGIIAAVTVGFDARAAFLDPRRGLGRVARSLVEALLQVVPNEIVVFVPHGVAVPPPWYPLAAAVVELRRPRRGAFLVDAPAWRLALHRHRVDVLHLPAWGVPRGLPVPVVATGHDATPLRFLSPPGAWQRRRLVMALRSLRRATVVHAVSEHARDELARFAGVPSERIRVVHNGVGPPFSAAPAPSAPPRHLLYVGGLDPHKNVALLVEMLTLQAARTLPPLVIVGQPVPDRGPLAAAAASGRLRFEGAASDEALAELYRRALALLLPSRNEGFGLPALEAMACGCPVVAAAAGALPEVCGDAAILLSPDSPRAWLEAAASLGPESELRRRLVDAGLRRAAGLTWTAAARGLVDLYRTASRVSS